MMTEAGRRPELTEGREKRRILGRGCPQCLLSGENEREGSLSFFLNAQGRAPRRHGFSTTANARPGASLLGVPERAEL